MFRHLERTKNSPRKFELSSCNKNGGTKEFSKSLFFNIYVFVNNYFVSVPFSCNFYSCYSFVFFVTVG